MPLSRVKNEGTKGEKVDFIWRFYRLGSKETGRECQSIIESSSLRVALHFP